MTIPDPIVRGGYTITPELNRNGEFLPMVHDMRITAKDGTCAFFPARLYSELTDDRAFLSVVDKLWFFPAKRVIYELPDALAPYYRGMQEIADSVRPVVPHERVIPMGEPFAALPLPIADTELDDEIEQILGRFLDDSLERIHARNQICAAITARGYDVYTRRPKGA